MDLKETLKYYKINSIWHFTDLSNLASIKKNGLLSLYSLTKNNINVSCYGADELSHYLDRKKGLDKYIHLSLIKEHPMQYLKTKQGIIQNPIWLEIDTSVLFENESGCCSQIANASSSICYMIEKLSKIIDLDNLINNKNCKYEIKKAQLLVANKIEYTKVKAIHYG